MVTSEYASKGKCTVLTALSIRCFTGVTLKTEVIDHCNGDTSDNRIGNLRCVTHAVNVSNQARCRGRRGVPPADKRGKDTVYDLITGKTENSDF